MYAGQTAVELHPLFRYKQVSDVASSTPVSSEAGEHVAPFYSNLDLW